YNDEFAVFSDKNGEGDKAHRAWELYNDGTYGYFDQPGALSWGVDADLWITSYYKKAVVTGVEAGNKDLYPDNYSLSQNYPNPFNPSTTIRFNLIANAKVTLRVFNILGQVVTTLINKNMNAGNHSIAFDASRLTSGMYIYKLDAKASDGTSFSQARKMMLIK
ncbi:MAG: T9SS type A sorting domain-containing protein, partial [Syntrophothermus sp.]